MKRRSPLGTHITVDPATGRATITCPCGWSYTSLRTLAERPEPTDTDPALHAEHEHHLRTTKCGDLP